MKCYHIFLSAIKVFMRKLQDISNYKSLPSLFYFLSFLRQSQKWIFWVNNVQKKKRKKKKKQKQEKPHKRQNFTNIKCFKLLRTLKSCMLKVANLGEHCHWKKNVAKVVRNNPWHFFPISVFLQWKLNLILNIFGLKINNKVR